MFSSFVLFIKADDILPLKAEVERWKDIAGIVATYKQKDYYFVELLVLEERGPAELFRFVLRQFDFIALHQSKSTYIFIKDKQDFKSSLLDLYDKATKDYFFYDMMSIEERYHALMIQGLEDKLDFRVWYYNYKSGAYYSLKLTDSSTFLFDGESCVDILDDETGSIEEYDIMEGLTDFEYHIGILSFEKLEKTK